MKTAILAAITALAPCLLTAGELSDWIAANSQCVRADERPVVILYTDTDSCVPCRSLEASIRAYGESKLPFRIERRAPNGQSIPRFVWGKWYHAGYEPIEHFVRRWEYANSLQP